MGMLGVPSIRAGEVDVYNFGGGARGSDWTAIMQPIKCRENEATMLANVGSNLYTRWAVGGMIRKILNLSKVLDLI